ncbi:pyridoxal phosphate homeostasis protein-like [Saccoglossus kowalevskii]|uniref:Pyridoxal phosphate homeostasis protein n=1 Tax=Saccoglossus kowalevskii TaxID=10224 RepID=A0ABM0ML28_SACKO|nr:PREDICTED: proline synthase co-transcribed bacterial homolog protein-like [Saccoglossus kowalevskii]
MKKAVMMAADNDVGKTLKSVLERIQTACDSRSQDLPKVQPRLVAVSKTKAISTIQTAYIHGQRHFGENYVHEIIEKATDPTIINECCDIRWHYVGHLQRNKVNKIIGIPNLFMVESLDTPKLADVLNAAWGRKKKVGKLKVMVQVNTSNEASKHGCKLCDAESLAGHILLSCSNLEFNGLMTIGRVNHELSQGPNPDFQQLVQCREEICKKFMLDKATVELSMGMSNDFEHAISVGSTNVRVGSAIFGARPDATKQSKSRTKNVVSKPEASNDNAAMNHVSQNLDSLTVS